jgi:hypothetical protein
MRYIQVLQAEQGGAEAARARPVRSAASKRGAETRKVLKGMRAAEDERVVLAWKAYCRGDDGTRTWSAREQEKPIAALPHVADPLGR